MDIQKKIDSLVRLGEIILEGNKLLEEAKIKAYRDNNWFTEEQVDKALNAIAKGMLDRNVLQSFSDIYHLDSNIQRHKVGLIPAGNIPLVGFHDVICCFLSNKQVRIKLSDKDKNLLPALIKLIAKDFPEINEYIDFVDKLSDFDAIIATGSNNTNRYFEHYFKAYPKILRKNRSSLAVLDGSESEDELRSLANDAFSYFGLGCRSISKVYIPLDYDVTKLFPAFSDFQHYKDHHKFRNNFEYNTANLLLNEDEFLTDDVFILKEDKSLLSRISILHYERYNGLDKLANELESIEDQLQCVSSNKAIGKLKTIPLGLTQQPSMTDYADGVDSVQFLLGL